MKTAIIGGGIQESRTHRYRFDPGAVVTFARIHEKDSPLSRAVVVTARVAVQKSQDGGISTQNSGIASLARSRSTKPIRSPCAAIDSTNSNLIKGGFDVDRNEAMEARL